MSRFKDRHFKVSSAVHLPLACDAAPMAGATTRGRWPAGGAASRAIAALTTDAAAQHPQPAGDATPTATAEGLHLPEDGSAAGVHLPPTSSSSYPKTSTMPTKAGPKKPTTPRQITSLCSIPPAPSMWIPICFVRYSIFMSICASI
jgi:hypothetical protein